MAERLRTGDAVAARYATAMRVAIVAILAVWHLVYDVLIIARGWHAYESRAAAVIAWLLLTAVQAAGSILLLRGGSRPGVRVRHLLGVVALAAGVLAVLSYPTGQAVSDISWAWNTAGWCGVLLLLHRPLPELCALLAVNAAITVVAVAADGALDRVALSRLMVITCATAGVQLLFAIVGHRLDIVARQAAASALDQAAARSRAASDEAVHTSRRQRYAQIRDRVLPLLRGLADGSADPDDPAVRRDAGIEAGRLRRLFAETDDTPDPLLHELRSCADLAERRGVEVTFLVCGSTPDVPRPARRRLTEVVLRLLVSTASRARLTVLADDTGVTVGVTADAPIDVLNDLPAGLRVPVTLVKETNEIWVDLRWDRLYASG